METIPLLTPSIHRWLRAPFTRMVKVFRIQTTASQIEPSSLKIHFKFFVVVVVVVGCCFVEILVVAFHVFFLFLFFFCLALISLLLFRIGHDSMFVSWPIKRLDVAPSTSASQSNLSSSSSSSGL